MLHAGIRLLDVFGLRRRKTPGAESAKSSSKTGGEDDEPVPWVPVFVVFNEVQARITAARLNDEGIDTWIRQEGASRALPVNLGLLGQIQVMVPEPMQERAEAILEDLAQSAGQEDESE